MKLIKVNGEREVLGRNAAMKLLLAMEHCPVCGLLPTEHDDEFCDMRFSLGITKEELCLT